MASAGWGWTGRSGAIRPSTTMATVFWWVATMWWMLGGTAAAGTEASGNSARPCSVKSTASPAGHSEGRRRQGRNHAFEVRLCPVGCDGRERGARARGEGGRLQRLYGGRHHPAGQQLSEQHRAVQYHQEV